MSWNLFKENYLAIEELDFALDLSKIAFSADFRQQMEPRLQVAYSAMQALEAGAIANPDENRMVGHYWLRNAALAPTPAIRADIEACLQNILALTARVHWENCGCQWLL